MTDIASVGVKIDTSGVDGAIKSLETFAGKGEAVDRAIGQIEGAATKAKKSMDDFGRASSQAAKVADVGAGAQQAAAGFRAVGDSAEKSSVKVVSVMSSVNAWANSVRAAAAENSFFSTSTIKSMAGVEGLSKAIMQSGAAAKQAAGDHAGLANAMNNSTGSAARAEQEIVRVLREKVAQLRSVISEYSGYAAQNRSAAGAVQQLEAEVRKQARSMEESGRAAQSMGSAIGGMRASVLSLAGALGVGLSLREFISAADSMTVVRNQLKAVSASAEEAKASYEGLFTIAQASSVSFTELSGTYASIARSTRGLGLSQKELLTVTSSIANAMKITGGSAESMNAALVQLGQGMAAGTLRGDELNSVMEQIPRLSEAIADGMGVTVGQLRKFGAEGKISAEAVVNALISQNRVLTQEVQGASLTVSQAMTQVGNAFNNLVGNADESAGATSIVAQELSRLASVMSAPSTQQGFAHIAGGLARIASLAVEAASEFGTMGDIIAREMARVTGSLSKADAIEGEIQDIDRALNNSILGKPVKYLFTGEDELKQKRDSLVKQLEEIGATATKTKEEVTSFVQETAKEMQKLPDNSGKITEFLARYGSGAQKTSAQIAEAMAKAKEAFGDSVPKEVEAAITQFYSKATSGAKTHRQAVNAVADAYKSLAGSWFKDISDAIAEQEAATLGLTRAETDLLKLKKSGDWAKFSQQQREHLELLTAQRAEIERNAEAQRLHDNAIREALQSGQQTIQQIQERIDRVKEETKLIGASAKQVAEYQAQRIRAEADFALLRAENIRLRDAESAEIDLLIQRYQKLQELADAELGKAAAKANEIARKEIERQWESTSKTIGDTLADYIMGGGKNAAQYLKRLFATLILQPRLQAVASGISGALGGPSQGGIASVLGGAGGGISGILSGAQSLWSAFSGGLVSSLASGISSLGGLFGSSALSSLAAGMRGASLAAGLAGPTTAGAGGLMGAGAALAGAMPWLAGVAAVAMGWRRLFGRTLADVGIEGTFGGEAGFDGRQYQFYRGGVFRSDRRQTSEIDENTRSMLGGAFNEMRAQVTQFADAIGLEANRLREYTSSFSLSTKGMNEEQIRDALMNAMRNAGDAMAQSILGQNNPFVRAGESSIDALERLAGSLLAANKIFATLGHTLYEASIAGGDMASQLVDLFGGREAMQSVAGDYLARYYSDKERSEIAMRQMSEAFGELGFAMPEGLAAMRQLIEAQDLTTEAGRRHYASLMQLSAAYADAQQLAEQVAEAERERAAAIVQEQQQKIAGLYATAEISAEAIAKSLRDGMLGRIGSEDLGAQLAEQIIGGIHNSVASGFAQQITDLFTGQIITPVLQAAAAGAVTSAAVSQAAIDSVVAQAQASMAALQAIINDAGFQSLLAQVREAVAGVAGSVGTAPKTTAALAGGMGGMAAATERATGASKQHTDAQSQHASLLRELYRLEGRFAELRQLELQQIDPANRAMQQRIWLLEREQAIAAKLYDLDNQMLQLQGDTAALRERQLQEMIRSFDRYALAGTGAAGSLGEAAKELTRVQQLAKYGQDSAGFISQLRPEDRRSMFEEGREAFLRMALDEAQRVAAAVTQQAFGQALERGDVSEARYEREYQRMLDRHLDQLDMGIARAIAEGHEASALRALEMVNSIRGREGALRDGKFDGMGYSGWGGGHGTTRDLWEAMFGKGFRPGAGTLEQLNAFTRLNALRGNEGLFAVDNSRAVKEQAEQTIQQQRHRLKELEAQIKRHESRARGPAGVAIGEGDLINMRHHAAQAEALQAQADGIRKIIAEQEKKVQDAIQADLDALIKRQRELWAAQDAAAVKAERDGLWKQWLQAIGDQGALRDLERAALNEANRALFDQINAQVDLNKARGEYEGLWKQWLQLTDEAAAREIERAALLSDTSRALYDQIHAYRELKGAVESATGAISNEIERLLGVGKAENSRSYLQAQFAVLTAQARAGDANAAQQLPAIVQALEEAIKGSASSASEVRTAQIAMASSLQETQAALDAVLKRAAQFDPDSRAPTERAQSAPGDVSVTPPPRVLDQAGHSPALLAEVQLLRQELKAAVEAGFGANVRQVKRAADVLEKFAREGLEVR